MRLASILTAAVVALSACAQPTEQKVGAAKAPDAKAEAPKPAAAPPAAAPAAAPAAPAWDLAEADVLRLEFTSGATRLRLECPEGKKELKISASPLPPGATLPLQPRGAVIIGGKSYRATFVSSAGDMNGGVVTSIKADADSVTALMQADNITVTVADPAASWTGTPSQSGVFDIAATTCAQINGLR